MPLGPLRLGPLLLLCHALASGGGAQGRAGIVDTAPSVHRIVGAFQQDWEAAWKRSARARHSLRIQGPTLAPDIHCHRAGPPREYPFGGLRVGMQVSSALTDFAVCPVWQIRGGGLYIDEARDIDAALAETERIQVRERRARALAQLGAVAAAQPTNRTAFEQLIRLLVDQKEHAAAEQWMARCALDEHDCMVLSVFVTWARGDAVAASRFARSLQPSRMCDMAGAELVLPSAQRQAWNGLPCEQRVTLWRRALWLADPLWSDTITSRLAEQVYRHVLVRVRSEFGRDERFLWDDRRGSDARREMVLRYGWPSYIEWSGPDTDREHTVYLSGPPRNSPDNEPYTSNEYRAPRVSALPSWDIIRNPYRALAADLAPVTLTNRSPWPQEFGAVSEPITSFEVGQVATLRRSESVELWLAFHGSSLASSAGVASTIPVRVLWGEGPDDTRAVADTIVDVAPSVALRQRVPNRPGVVSVESIPRSARVAAARSRFGVVPSALPVSRPSDSLTISAPVLLRHIGVDGNAAISPERALALMLPSTDLGATGVVGIYWETYGAQLTDSLEIAVWIGKPGGDGLLRRVGQSLRIVPSASSRLGAAWVTTGSDQGAVVLAEGAGTWIARSISLNLAGLAPGEYAVEVAVARPGTAPTRAQTIVRVLPPG